MSQEYRSGFIALIGRPNVGKSTLLNYLLGQKISIVSDKAQTTRNKILGVYSQPHYQMVFIDTPGIHKPKHKLGEWMRQETMDAIKEVDALVLMASALDQIGPGDRYISDLLKTVEQPVLLAINKIDLVQRERLLAVIDNYRKLLPFAAIVPISAQTGAYVDDLVNELVSCLPPGPQYFPEDMVTDRPERNIIAEIIREKLLLRTREELPHALAVEIEEITTRNNGTIYVRAVIYVERNSQKQIVIGKNGEVLREVGRDSRMDIEELLHANVYLDVWVKVAADWRNRKQFLQQLGYE